MLKDWQDAFMVSKEEMRTILEGTNWEVRDFIDGEHGLYVAILEKKGI